MECETTEDMIDWLQKEYGEQFDFNKIAGAIELMLTNHRRKVLKEGQNGR